MGAIFDILSGNRYRRNKAERIVLGDALRRYKASAFSGHPMLARFAFALAWAVNSTVEILVFDSKKPEFRALAKSADPTIFSDLASFIGWRHTYLFVADDKAAVGKSGEPASESATAWWHDVTRVSEVMYPRSAVVEAALAEYRDTEAKAARGEATSQYITMVSRVILWLMKLNIKMDPYEKIDPALGSDFYLRKVALSFTIDAAFAATRNMIAHMLSKMPE